MKAHACVYPTGTYNGGSTCRVTGTSNRSAENTGALFADAADFDSLGSRRSPSRPKNHRLPRSSTDMRSSMSRVCKPVASCPYLSELAVGFQLFVFPWDARYLRNYHL